MTRSLTYLLTRVKSRDASASNKNRFEEVMVVVVAEVVDNKLVKEFNGARMNKAKPCSNDLRTMR